MSTSSSTLFSGASRYSSDFQQVISRAVRIASLPVTLIQNHKAELIGESAALSSLDAKFASLQSALGSLGSATATSGTYTSAVSDSSIATASLSTGIRTGKYTLTVDDLGDYSRVVSNGTPAVADPSASNITSDSEVRLRWETGRRRFRPAARSTIWSPILTRPACPSRQPS